MAVLCLAIFFVCVVMTFFSLFPSLDDVGLAAIYRLPLQ